MDLNSKFKAFDGSDFEGDTLRNACLNVLGGLKAKSGEDAIRSYDLGSKIINLKDVSDLSTEEKAHMITKINQAITDNLGYPAMVMAQMLKAFA